MRLSQLNGLHLIKNGSISKAAQESFMSQSAVFVSIKELEEELGQVILIRTKKGVAFSNYGLQCWNTPNEFLKKWSLFASWKLNRVKYMAMLC